MSEPKRITEAELASFERLSYGHEGAVGSVIRRLVDNERRLRDIVRRVGECSHLPATPQEDGFCIFCGALRVGGPTEPHRTGCVWPYLEHEAVEIREERGEAG